MITGLITAVVVSYFLGAIPTSIWVGKALQGVDVRNYGSGNAGATNTFRILGWKAGTLVLTIDLIKGFTAAYFVGLLAFNLAGRPELLFGAQAVTLFQLICGAVAVLAHMYPVYAGFRGGKGVITAVGMLLAIEPVSVALTLVVFLIILFTTRYVSLGSIIGSVSYPLFLLLLRNQFGFDIANTLLFISSAIAIVIIYKHRTNIQRLINGNENRITSFKPSKGRLNEEQAT